MAREGRLQGTERVGLAEEWPSGGRAWPQADGRVDVYGENEGSQEEPPENHGRERPRGLGIEAAGTSDGLTHLPGVLLFRLSSSRKAPWPAFQLLWGRVWGSTEVLVPSSCSSSHGHTPQEALGLGASGLRRCPGNTESLSLTSAALTDAFLSPLACLPDPGSQLLGWAPRLCPSVHGAPSSASSGLPQAESCDPAIMVEAVGGRGS